MPEKRLDFGIRDKVPESEGLHRNVYAHKKDILVVKQIQDNKDNIRDEKSAEKSELIQRRMKAEFYLAKIIRFLFPKNVPNIHLASGVKETMVNDRIALDDKNKILTEGLNRVKKGSVSDKDFDWNKYFVAESEFSNNPKIKKFIEALISLGIKIDEAVQNFTINSDGNIQYVDEILPWNEDNFFVQRNYNPEKLQVLIEDHLDTPDRRRALDYLKRLEHLYNEDVTRRDALSEK